MYKLRQATSFLFFMNTPVLEITHTKWSSNNKLQGRSSLYTSVAWCRDALKEALTSSTQAAASSVQYAASFLWLASSTYIENQFLSAFSWVFFFCPQHGGNSQALRELKECWLKFMGWQHILPSASRSVSTHRFPKYNLPTSLVSSRMRGHTEYMEWPVMNYIPGQQLSYSFLEALPNTIVA